MTRSRMRTRYFNEVYADPSDDHPVTLFINDYNTEQVG